MSDLLGYFDRVVVISLPRRDDRLRGFFRQLPTDWPFKSPVLAVGVDGRSLTTPSWWNSGNGAWGCYRSHLKVIENALCDDCSSILIMEDDARCVSEFTGRARSFYQNLPIHEGLQYLGGQLLRYRFGLPVKLNEFCYRPFNVNRMHAYAIRGRQHLEYVYNHLADLRNWGERHHADHHLATLHESQSIPVVCPRDWLFVQGATTSDITGEELAETTFRGAEELVNGRVDRKAVAVVGTYRSGSSLTAGMLHQAGINMGASFQRPNTDNPSGFFEAEELSGVCRRAFQEPELNRVTPPGLVTGLLQRWGSDRCEALLSEAPAFGGKHPLMGLLIPELMAAWESPYFVCTERPIGEIVQSLKRVNGSWPADAIERMIPMMIRERDQQLRRVSGQVIRVPFHRARTDPVGVMNELAKFIGVPLSQQSIVTAARHARG